MKIPFQSSPSSAAILRKPEPTALPELISAQLAAVYRAARVGGDFYDFVQVDSKLLFVLLDIAGKRETALHIAAAAQDLFRTQGKNLFAGGEIEDSEAITRLLLEMNRAIMAAAGGVCCAPTFLGCFDEAINTLPRRRLFQDYLKAGELL